MFCGIINIMNNIYLNKLIRLIVAALIIVCALTFTAYGKTQGPSTDILRNQLNDFISESFENGMFDELHDKWFKLGNEGKDLDYDSLTGENGTITFGTKTIEPFIFKLNGKYVGYTMDIIFRFCKEYGYKLEVKDYSSSNTIVMAAGANKIDFGGSAISITEERKKSADFSEPYFYNSGGIIIRKSDAEKYHDVDDLKGKRIGTETGTLYPDLIRSTIEDAEVFEYNTTPDALTALQNNKIDASMEDHPILEYIGLGYPDLMLIKDMENGDKYGFVFPKTNANTGLFAGLKSSFEKTFIIGERWKEFGKGITTTLLITLLSIVIGAILGFAVYILCRKGGKIPNAIKKVFALIIHGMPEVVLLMIFYYIIFGKLDVTGILVAVVVFSILFCINIEDMLTNAVNAIDKGQFEASLALGYSDRSTFYKIILPESLKYFLPNFKSAVVSQIKSTAIVGYIAVQDLTKTSDIIRSSTYEAFFPLIVTAIFYFLMVWVLTVVVNKIEINNASSMAKTMKFLKGVDLHDRD